MPVIPTYAETVANATHSFGTRLAHAPYTPPGGSDVLTLIHDVKEITFNGRKLSEIEVSHLLSPGKWKEFIPGFGDGGTVGFKVNYDDAQAAVLEALVPTPTSTKYGLLRWFVITPNLGLIEFYGFLQPPNDDFGQDAEILLNGEIRVSGEIIIIPP